MPLEIEEKLQVHSSRVFDRIRQDGHVARLPIRRGRLVIQHDTYLDTPDGLLYREGASLRLREKDGRVSLTLKTPVEGTRIRDEEEAFLTEDQASDAAGGWLHRVACDVAASAVGFAGTPDLRPVVLAHNQRETWYISSHMGSAKMCFDWVHYASARDGADAPAAEEYELEVELQQGPRSVVTQIAQDLSRKYGLSHQADSKYARGVLLTGAFANPAGVLAQPVLDPALTAV